MTCTRATAEALTALIGECPTQAGSILSSLDGHYAPGEIPKRDGSTRHLSIPDEELKALQSRLAEEIHRRTEPSPISSSTKGRGRFWAAERHKSKPWIAHADVEDFFPSISRTLVCDALEGIGLDGPTAQAATRLATEGGSLPQGAPSSPVLADLVLREVDLKVLEYADRLDIVVTRYGDDFMMSGSSLAPLQELVKFLARCLDAFGLRLNRRKTRFAHRSNRQVCLGLVVNDRVSTIKRSAKGGSAMSRERIATWVRRVECGGFRNRGEFEQLMGHLSQIGKCHPRLGAELKDRVRVAWNSKPC